MEKPTRENDVFDHSVRDMAESTGVSEEALHEKINTINEGIKDMSEEEYTHPSRVVELLMKNCTKKELAILFHCEHERAGELERAHQAQDFLSKIMGAGGQA